MHPSKLQKNGFVIKCLMAVDAVPWAYLVTVTHLALCFSLIVTAYFCTSSTDFFLQVSHSQLHVTDFCCWMLWWIACKRLATSALHVAIQTSNNISDCTLHSTHTQKKKINYHSYTINKTDIDSSSISLKANVPRMLVRSIVNSTCDTL